MNESVLAVFSDVHSNLEALEAVLADMDALGIKNHICLGDIVGYGPSPGACLKRIRALNCPILLGNHDNAAATDTPLENLRDIAVAGIEFSRTKLSGDEKLFLKSLPLTAGDEECQFVHSSLIEPSEWDYITTELEADVHFGYQHAPICFSGHTHVPMVWQKIGDKMPTGRRGVGKIAFQPECKYLINVGAVGQPRDLSSNSCYVIFDTGKQTVEFRRVKYDIAKTRKKISRAKLPKFLGQRLALGR